jgi:RHS repeat-associated protein
MAMRWDDKDQLQQVDLGGGGTVSYIYDAGGHRVRKVIENQNGVRKEERVYLGGFEVYRRFGSDALSRETLHVMDDKQRIALVETRTAGDDGLPAQTVRYQLGNHLGSASLELGVGGALVSYEEYHPYGTSAFQAGRSATEVSLKRYRYTGKERDEETGFSYHGARYYAPWLGRWVSCDPKWLVDGALIYQYVGSNPVKFIDESGLQKNNPKENNKTETKNTITSKGVKDREVLKKLQEKTSTPIPDSVDIDTSNNVSLKIKSGNIDVNIVILPDKKVDPENKTIDPTASTSAKIEEIKTPSATISGIKGSNTKFWKVNSINGRASVTISIRTTYPLNLDPKSPSAYGRGTTDEDKKRGNTSLRFHEGSHGSDFIDFFIQKNFPQFKAFKGMTALEYKESQTKFTDAIISYVRDAQEYSRQKTDETGVSQSSYHQAKISNREAAIMFNNPSYAELPDYIRPFVY